MGKAIAARNTKELRFEPYIISRSKYLEIWIAAFLSVFLLAHVNFRTFLLGILLEFLLFFSMMAALAREGYWNMFFVSFTVLLLLIFSLKMSDNQFTKQLFALVLIPYIPICLLGYFYLNGGFYDKFTLIFISPHKSSDTVADEGALFCTVFFDFGKCSGSFYWWIVV